MPETPNTAPECIPARARLDDADKGMIVFLAGKGKTQTEIAQVVGCDQSVVSRWLQKIEPTVDLAKKRAHNLALPAVESLRRSMRSAEKTGKSGPQEALLKMAGCLGDESIGPRVIVQIGIQDSEVQIGMGLSPQNINELAT